MTVTLYDAHPEDIEELVVAWLTPLGRTSIIRKTGDPLPFRLVQHITGSEDPDLEIADPVVSVHTLCARSAGSVAARDAADSTHRRMLALHRYQETITLPDDREATIDYLSVFQTPLWTPFEDDQILRKTARYQLGLSYVPA